MMLVPVRADRSPIHGLGLFATEPIAAGTPVWRLQPGFDQVFPTTAFATLPAPAQAHLRHFAYLDPVAQHWVLNGDLTIFMNHADSPNTGVPGQRGPALVTLALRPIAAGEELTCNYHAFDASTKPLP